MRITLFIPVAIVVAVLGWQAAVHFGIDESRLPLPPFDAGETVVVIGDGTHEALASQDAASLRDARFARHNGIAIDTRIDSGDVRFVPTGARLKVMEVDMDLVRVREQDEPQAVTPFWIALETLQATPQGKP